ncbi:helix-turn-helix domain-containing protein [Rhodovastum atsumiense]
MIRMGLVSGRLTRPTAMLVRGDDEFTPAEIAARLNMPEGTVYSWLYKGRLPARRAVAADRSLWLIRLDDVERLLHQRGSGGRLPSRPSS